MCSLPAGITIGSREKPGAPYSPPPGTARLFSCLCSPNRRRIGLLRTSALRRSKKFAFRNIHLAEARLSTWQMYRPLEHANVSAGLVSLRAKVIVSQPPPAFSEGGENAGALRGVS